MKKVKLLAVKYIYIYVVFPYVLKKRDVIMCLFRYINHTVGSPVGFIGLTVMTTVALLT